MMRRITLSLFALLMAAAPASAQRGLASPWADEQRENRDGRESQREVPLSSILRELRMRYGGQHLDATKAGGRYIISWITEDGRRLVIEVDTATGRTLSVRG